MRYLHFRSEEPCCIPCIYSSSRPVNSFYNRISIGHDAFRAATPRDSVITYESPTFQNSKVYQRSLACLLLSPQPRGRFVAVRIGFCHSFARKRERAPLEAKRKYKQSHIHLMLSSSKHLQENVFSVLDAFS